MLYVYPKTHTVKPRTVSLAVAHDDAGRWAPGATLVHRLTPDAVEFAAVLLAASVGNVSVSDTEEEALELVHGRIVEVLN